MESKLEGSKSINAWTNESGPEEQLRELGVGTETAASKLVASSSAAASSLGLFPKWII